MTQILYISSKTQAHKVTFLNIESLMKGISMVWPIYKMHPASYSILYQIQDFKILISNFDCFLVGCLRHLWHRCKIVMIREMNITPENACFDLKPLNIVFIQIISVDKRLVRARWMVVTTDERVTNEVELHYPILNTQSIRQEG